MKPRFWMIAVIGLMLLAAACGGAPQAEPTAPVPTAALEPTAKEFAERNLHWFGTAAFLYQGSKILYFDPVSLEGDLPLADIILVSHGHSDHWSLEDIRKVAGPGTVLVVSPNVMKESTASHPELGIPVTVIHEGETVEIQGVSITGVPAYGNYHTRESGGLGFVVAVDGQRIYFAGGTAAYPEMAQIQSDIAIYPAYRKEDAAQVVDILPTKVMIFMHTSSAGASAFATVFAAQKPEIAFVALAAGPYTPAPAGN
jgi:L-ascorbate metabolism protein UlaG (beta-lactamase superfamily)